MIISERKLIGPIGEAISKRLMLTEDREGKNLALARKLLYSKGYSQDQANQILISIRQDIPNVHIAKCKFILGVTRMFTDGELKDGRSILNLNTTLKYVGSDYHVNEYDHNLNGMSLNDIVARFSTIKQTDIEQQRNTSNSKQRTVNRNYAIVPIDNAKEASKYGRYTSWCVTHDEEMYKNYTSNGLGRFYFCLRNGFENEKAVVGENAPLDAYGLSMIAISVNPDGSLNTCTCRWNHDNGGNDSIMDIDQIENLLGVNFFETFKPYSRDELRKRGMLFIEDLSEGAYIDLGLPSGTKWASCNIGASNPTECGMYYQWGNVNGVYGNDNTTVFDESTYDYDKYTEFSVVDGVRIPTVEQFEELIKYTFSKWCNVEGVDGRLFTSISNGNSIFIPASGCRRGRTVYEQGNYGFLRSSSLLANLLDRAFSLYFYSGYCNMSNSSRCHGLCLRGVL